jgi:hypothetical protein
MDVMFHVERGTTLGMEAFAVHLRTLTREGFSAVGRLAGLWFLVGMALVLTAVAFHAPLPLREPGRFSLTAVALVNQFLVNLMAGAVLLLVRPPNFPGWWPITPLRAIGLRHLGMVAAMACLLVPLCLLQYLWALALEEMTLADPVTGTEHRLDGAYAHLGLRLVAYGAVLLAWAQFLRANLGPSAALLAYLTLVFAAFLLPQVSQASPILAPLVAILPRLGSLAPVEWILGDWPAFWGQTVPYAVIHIGMVWCAGALIRGLRSLPRHIDFSS